jgi:hypothetical protein
MGCSKTRWFHQEQTQQCEKRDQRLLYINLHTTKLLKEEALKDGKT